MRCYVLCETQNKPGQSNVLRTRLSTACFKLLLSFVHHSNGVSSNNKLDQRTQAIRRHFMRYDGIKVLLCAKGSPDPSLKEEILKKNSR